MTERTLEFRNAEWRTADGRIIKVKEMTLGHLVNVLNWISDNSESYPPTLLPEVFIPEANYRQMQLFATGAAYPNMVDGRWVIIDPATGAGRIELPPADYIEATKDNEAYQEMAARTQEKRNSRKK